MNSELATFEPAGRSVYGRLPRLTRAGLVHGFSCRDLAPAGTSAATTADTAGRLADHLGLRGLPRVTLQQRHTARVHIACADVPLPDPPPVGDALVTGGAGVVLTVATADCLPLLAFDPTSRVAAAVHAGWRGTLAGVLPAALGAMFGEMGATPAATWVAAGPGIRSCCYEVGPEVASAFLEAWEEAENWLRRRNSRSPHLDLVGAARSQAMQAGIPESNFLDTGWCTRCLRERFYSYRADGPGTGRIVTLASVAPADRLPPASKGG